MIYNANGFYPHEAQILNEFNSLAVSKKEYLLVTDIVLKNIWKHLIYIRSLIEHIF